MTTKEKMYFVSYIDTRGNGPYVVHVLAENKEHAKHKVKIMQEIRVRYIESVSEGFSIDEDENLFK